MGDVVEFKFPERMITNVGLCIDETHSVLSLPFEIKGQGIRSWFYCDDASEWRRYEVTTRALKKLISEYPLIRQACESFECPSRYYELLKDEILDGAGHMRAERKAGQSSTATYI